MFRIKICGLTSAEDAALVAAAGADAVGLNFYPQSPRFLAPPAAERIVEALPRGVVKVGLFVNAAADEICRTFDRLGLDLVQLHGDEPPGLLAQLGDRPVMRAFRVGPDGLAPVERYLAECGRLGCLPRLVLVDAHVRGLYGGSGKLADWDAIRHYPADGSLPPLVLAGGLSPENVGEAVRTVHPAGVDTASGVESSPGRKDPALVRRFVAAALDAFASGG
jgi:phosphoribosylanthranilate isomerase